MNDAARVHTRPSDLESLLGDLDALDAVVATWDETPRQTVEAIKNAIDALNRTAFERLIRTVKSDPGALDALKAAVTDDVVYAVLRHHGLVKPSLQERVERALDSVRPMLASHGGNVELVALNPPDTVDVRLLGACDGCPASGVTLGAGVEKAISEHCPEITHVRQVKGRLGSSDKDSSNVDYVSPFAHEDDRGWLPACDLQQVPEGDLLPLDVNGEALLLSRIDERVVCYHNACAHLAMPLDQGEVRDGILTCPHHGFQYLIETGECISVPEVQLRTHAVRVRGGRVEIKLS
jgi:Fe-S cluster biogenesis protein NfuA/nitrite reductase/ring-hydroxylating ferredoxin subunit